MELELFAEVNYAAFQAGESLLLVPDDDAAEVAAGREA